MSYLGDALHFFTQCVPDTILVLEEWRQEPAVDVAILVYRRVQDGAAVIPVPGRIVCTAPKERDTEWRSANNHQLSLLLAFDRPSLLFFSTVNQQISCLTSKRAIIGYPAAEAGKSVRILNKVVLKPADFQCPIA
jgi:hypothetical protein